jgi:hypothetical protein
MMKEGSLIESQHAPKATTQGTSYADIMATSPPKQPETVEVLPSQPSEIDTSSAPTDESAASPEPETVLMEHLESLHLSSSAKPVVALPTPVTTPAPSPQVPSEISTFDLPSPVSTRESSHVNEPPAADEKPPNPESVLFTTSKKFEKKKRYGGFTFVKGDPEKLERLNQKGSNLESRWAC